jgi:hypothetical protein
VAPVLNPTPPGAVTERAVYLPGGAWFDFWTQQRHRGLRDIVWRDRDQQRFPDPQGASPDQLGSYDVNPQWECGFGLTPRAPWSH